LKRRLFNLIAVISLLLCATSAMLWTRSYFTADYLRRNSTHSIDDPYERTRSIAYIFHSSAGVLLLGRSSELRDVRSLGPLPTGWRHDQNKPPRPVMRFRTGLSPDRLLVDFIGFQLFVQTNHPLIQGYDQRWLRIPYWMLFLVQLPLPMFWLTALARTQYRGIHHRCLTCGYDLRASADLCPECGSPTNDLRLIKLEALSRLAHVHRRSLALSLFVLLSLLLGLLCAQQIIDLVGFLLRAASS
jgi:hypothetical protein